MEFTVKTELDLSGFKQIEKFCNSLNSARIQSGVLKADAKTVEKAKLNEYGGVSVYDRGPYAGEEVRVPPRSFVNAPAEHTAPDALKKASKKFSDGFTESNIEQALDIVGKEVSEAQRRAIETNGNGANADWVKHNEPRTIATKGFDKPLYTVNNETFPIDYEVVK